MSINYKVQRGNYCNWRWEVNSFYVKTLRRLDTRLISLYFPASPKNVSQTESGHFDEPGEVSADEPALDGDLPRCPTLIEMHLLLLYTSSSPNL